MSRRYRSPRSPRHLSPGNGGDADRHLLLDDEGFEIVDVANDGDEDLANVFVHERAEDFRSGRHYDDEFGSDDFESRDRRRESSWERSSERYGESWRRDSRSREPRRRVERESRYADGRRDPRREPDGFLREDRDRSRGSRHRDEPRRERVDGLHDSLHRDESRRGGRDLLHREESRRGGRDSLNREESRRGVRGSLNREESRRGGRDSFDREESRRGGRDSSNREESRRGGRDSLHKESSRRACGELEENLKHKEDHSTSSNNRGDSRSVSRNRDRVYTYVQGDIDKAYLEMSNQISRHSYMITPLDDLEKRLPNLWEGTQGLMEHVLHKFPMPDKLDENTAQSHSGDRTSVNMETAESTSSDSTKQSGLRNLLSDAAKQSKAGSLPSGDGTLVKKEIREPASSDVVKGTIPCVEKDAKLTIKPDPEAQSGLESAPNHEETPGNGVNQEAESVTDWKCESELVVMDVCGEVDDIDTSLMEGVDNGNTDDLMLALSNEDKSGTEAHDEKEEQMAEETVMEISRGVDVNEKQMSDKNTTATSRRADVECASLKSNKNNGSTSHDKDRNSTSKGRSSSRTLEKSSSSKPAVTVPPPSSSYPFGVTTEVNGLERLLHKKWDPAQPKLLKETVKMKFRTVDRVVQSMRQRCLDLKKRIQHEQKYSKSVPHVYFDRVSEIGCLIHALFSECEAYRCSLDPKNKDQALTVAKSVCKLSVEETVPLKVAYKHLKEAFECLRADYHSIIEENKAEVEKFNSSPQNNGIRIVSPQFLSASYLYNKFQRGGLKLYMVTPLLTDIHDIHKSILSKPQRYVLSGPSSLWYKGILPELRREHRKPETSKTGYAEFETQKHWERNLGRPEFWGPDAAVSETVKQPAAATQDTGRRMLNNTMYNRSRTPSPEKGVKSPCPESLPADEMTDSGFESRCYQEYDKLMENWTIDCTYLKSRLYVTATNFANQRAFGYGPKTQSLCSELVRLSSKIVDINLSYQNETKKLGQTASCHFLSQLNAAHSMIKSVYALFLNVYCKNFEVIQIFNSSEAAHSSGPVVTPQKLDALKKKEFILKPLRPQRQKGSVKEKAQPDRTFETNAQNLVSDVSHSLSQIRKSVETNQYGYSEGSSQPPPKRFRSDSQTFSDSAAYFENKIDRSNEGKDYMDTWPEGEQFYSEDNGNIQQYSTSGTNMFYGHEATDSATDFVDPSEDRSFDIDIKNDPALGGVVTCNCNVNCGGTVLSGIPSRPHPNLKLNPTEYYWHSLSLIMHDIQCLKTFLGAASKGFDLCKKDSHKNAATTLINICATLPHVAARLAWMQTQAVEFGYSETLSEDVTNLERQTKKNLFKANSIMAVEKALHEVYVKHDSLYEERKMVMFKWHPHAEKFRQLRTAVFSYEPDKPTVKPPAYKVKGKGKKNCPVEGLFASMGLASGTHKISKEKMAFYETMWKIQTQNEKIRDTIRSYEKQLQNKGFESTSDFESSVLYNIKKAGQDLVNLRDELLRNEVFRDKYGRNVPGYVQAMLKQNFKTKGGRKTMNNHIRNFDFILKLISMAGREMRAFVRKCSPEFQQKVDFLEVMHEDS